LDKDGLKELYVGTYSGFLLRYKLKTTQNTPTSTPKSVPNSEAIPAIPAEQKNAKRGKTKINPTPDNNRTNPWILAGTCSLRHPVYSAQLLNVEEKGRGREEVLCCTSMYSVDFLRAKLQEMAAGTKEVIDILHEILALEVCLGR